MNVTSWKTEDVALVLGIRDYMYAIFHRTFCNEPDKEMLEVLKSETTNQAFDFLLDGDKAADVVIKALGNIDIEALDALKDEYTALLIGPAKLVAPPWESVYLNDGELLFQESTLAVRQFYLEDGLLPMEYPHVADDHIALELDYVSKLAERLSLDKLNREEATALVDRQTRFLDEHLLLWVPKYAKRMSKSKRNMLYPQMVGLLESFLKVDRLLLDEVREIALKKSAV